MSGWRTFGSSTGQRSIFDFGFRSSDTDDFLSESFDRHFAWVANVDRFMEIGAREPVDAID
jgi:hypothetical protein